MLRNSFKRVSFTPVEKGSEQTTEGENPAQKQTGLILIAKGGIFIYTQSISERNIRVIISSDLIGINTSKARQTRKEKSPTRSENSPKRSKQIDL